MTERRFPTDIVTGFLEAGKTTYIQSLLESEEINRYETVLLFLCEEGEAEYCPARFHSERVHIVSVERPEDLAADRIQSLAKEIRPNRMIVEMNGMWDLSPLLEQLPPCCQLSEIITIIDAECFSAYFQNLRQQCTDKLRCSNRLIVNRVGEAFDPDGFLRVVSATAPRADVFYSDEAGTLRREDRVLAAYLLPAEEHEVLTVSDTDYPVLYRDLLQRTQAYDGRAIRLSGRMIRNAYGELLLGRYVMVCCMDDLAFSGLVANLPQDAPVPDGAWVTVQGRIRAMYSRGYGGQGPVLWAESVQRADAPGDEIIYLQ